MYENALSCMEDYGDDPLGMKLISDIVTNIEIDTGMVNEGFGLTYKKEFSADGLHYLMFATDHRYKKCFLKGMRCGVGDDR